MAEVYPDDLAPRSLPEATEALPLTQGELEGVNSGQTGSDPGLNLPQPPPGKEGSTSHTEAAAAGLAAERARDVQRPPAAPTSKLARIRYKLRQVGLALTMVLPQPVKRLVYRWCFGYRISPSARIGLAYLDCASLTLGDDSRIANLTVFLRCGEV